MRRNSTIAALAVLTSLLLGLAATPASAHPLGNSTINHYDGLTLSLDEIVDEAVVDVAEIPTLQRKSRIDADRDGSLSDAERSAYAAGQCAAMAREVVVVLDGRRVVMGVDRSSYVERPGAISLNASRLECTLRGDVDLTKAATLEFTNDFDSAGIGWHEVVATGDGVSLTDSPFPATSISDELRSYPADLLKSPLDVRGGTVAVRPGGGLSTYRAAEDLPVAGAAVRAVARLTTYFDEVVGRDQLTLGVGLLGLLLSLVLGAGHAFLPGHGKTVMAAYLVGRRGRLRDVVTVGATVTLTHTAGVIVLGLLLTSTAAFAPTAVYQSLGVVSGLIVAAVGVGLLVAALRARRTPRLALALQETPVLVGAAGAGSTADTDHGHGHDHGHEHGHDHGHGHGGHRHGFGRAHSHGPDRPVDGRFSRSGLVGLGVAGGLVPSPSALLVLLAAVALGRTWFGVALVLGYGLGMALALCTAGLLLVRLRGRLERLARGTRLARAERLLAVLPVLTAVLVIVVGTGLAIRALGGTV